MIIEEGVEEEPVKNMQEIKEEMEILGMLNLLMKYTQTCQFCFYQKPNIVIFEWVLITLYYLPSEDYHFQVRDSMSKVLDLFQANNSFLYPHENVRKPSVFIRFQGVQKQDTDLKWVDNKFWCFEIPAGN